MIFLLVFFSNLMHLSMLSPRGGGPGIPREFDSILWLRNNRRFDKTHDPEGGYV